MEEGLTGGAADVDPQSQAAVAVVVGGRGCREGENTAKPSALGLLQAAPPRKAS